ncbi:MAG: CHASE2 domain-containing serine/threonine-protein kinase [Panacagrimonas sp.]
MKKDFWSKDWFTAVSFAFVFLILAYLVLPGSFQGLERYAYDLGVRAADRLPSDRIAVIAIDDDSIQNLGRWPWPRQLHAEMIDKLRDNGARLVASTVFYSESQQDSDLAVLSELSDYLNRSPLTQAIPAEIATFGAILEDRDDALLDTWKSSQLAQSYDSQIQGLMERLAAAQGGLAADDALAGAMSDSGNVLLPMMFVPGRPQGNPDAPLPDYVSANAITQIDDRIGALGKGLLPPPMIEADVPVFELGKAAAGIGHLVNFLDADGALRSEPLVIQYYDQFYPSLPLLTAAKALNLSAEEIIVRLGEGVALGGVNIKTSESLRMRTRFYPHLNGEPPFPIYSFFDVKEDKIQAGNFKDKIVLIGATATGVGDAMATPVSANTAPVVAMAHSVSSILQGDYLSNPSWGGWVSLSVFLLCAAYLALLMPRLGPAIGFAVTGALVVVLLIVQFYMLTAQATWLRFAIPVAFLISGHLFMTVKKLRLTEKLKLSSDAESAESNKMLGLAFQGQGQLDMAFDKFKRVQPVDDKLLDLIYNLALDFERKRQFNKAENVYQYIHGQDKGFRDVQQKLARAKKLSETVILGSGGAAQTSAGTLIMGAGDVEKPMLGRYEVQSELGKGAMGVVYLGKDPKIGRMVAIKTMALSQEFEADELEDVKARFFREAETAGRLSHPHIVQIFDAGEEHDLAYIAMEFIKGYDLVRHTKPNGLLPIPEALRYAADAADALAYAHQNGIVHRDIKPANLMLVESSKTVKVTDFGIARITDASKTKTGMVLGTPSYMSPEQLAGKKVDGRSDLFSLGATLYQLLTGALPFQADSMATLMYKIANEPHAPMDSLRPDVPVVLNEVIDRILHKDLEQRYQDGKEVAEDLRNLMQALG